MVELTAQHRRAADDLVERKGRNELVLSCTRRGFDILAAAVRTADGILAATDAESPDIDDDDG
ncbi:hypothetical protein ABZ805_05860 [Saccharopolyspora sp. NPDC047091]|uniref:hypothetical protein n=1 Tax=Saccharopolyspora sp. NPDC047091 TaxID=3155924 RepID=UPI0033FB79CB